MYNLRVCSLQAVDMNAVVHIHIRFVVQGCFTCSFKECVGKCEVTNSVPNRLHKIAYTICFSDICLPPSSAGVGRTGTFIAVDAMMQRLKEKDDLDIYNFVTQMRTKRTFMVQNLVCTYTV